MACIHCSVKLEVDPQIRIACASDDECPAEFRCVTGMCVSVNANQASRVLVGVPGRSVGVVSIPITVADFEGDTVAFSATFDIAGVEVLATVDPLSVRATEQGVAAFLVWHAAADLGSNAFVLGVIVRVTPVGGQAAESLPFAFGNDPPEVLPSPLGGTKAGDVGIAFRLTDDEVVNQAGDLASISIEFSDSLSGPWIAAEISLGATTSLATSPSGISPLISVLVTDRSCRHFPVVPVFPLSRRSACS